jgi:superoxide reductase
MSHEILDIYKCENCDGVVMSLFGCGDQCELTCGEGKMKKLQPKTADAANEKHVPVIEKIDGGYKVVVGSTPHPMEQEHWINMIELRAGDRVFYQFLHPGDAPEATFHTDATDVSAREYCNVHGLWST